MGLQKTATCFIKMCKSKKQQRERASKMEATVFHNLTTEVMSSQLSYWLEAEMPHFTHLQWKRMLQGHEQETVGIMDILESSGHRCVPRVYLYISVSLALFLIYSALGGKELTVC